MPPEQCLGLRLGGEQHVGSSGRDQLAGRPPTIGQQWPHGRQVDGHERISLPCQLDRASARSPQRVAEQRVCRQVDQLDAVEPLGTEVVRGSGDRRRRGPPRTSARRRRPRARRSDRFARRPRASPGRCTPSRSSCWTSDRPAPSRPTAQTSWVLTPRRASQRAVFAADPPWRSRTRPGTSVPRSSGRLGMTTTSSIRSPRTRARADARRRLDRRSRRSRRADGRWRRAVKARSEASWYACSDGDESSARKPRDRHDPDPVDRRRPEGQLRPPRARRWARRRWPTPSGPASCATPRRTRTGPTATASSSRPGTPRCCSTRSST